MWRAKRGEEEEEKALKDRINHLLISAIFFDAFDDFNAFLTDGTISDSASENTEYKLAT